MRDDAQHAEGVVVCQTCGALVSEWARHAAWHRRQTNLAVKVQRLNERGAQ
ncbi:MAG: hypothetical protein ABR532_01535 [Candidatus Dormibacteria bacterium]